MVDFIRFAVDDCLRSKHALHIVEGDTPMLGVFCIFVPSKESEPWKHASCSNKCDYIMRSLTYWMRTRHFIDFSSIFIKPKFDSFFSTTSTDTRTIDPVADLNGNCMWGKQWHAANIDQATNRINEKHECCTRKVLKRSEACMHHNSK